MDRKGDTPQKERVRQYGWELLTLLEADRTGAGGFDRDQWGDEERVAGDKAENERIGGKDD